MFDNLEEENNEWYLVHVFDEVKCDNVEYLNIYNISQICYSYNNVSIYNM